MESIRQQQVGEVIKRHFSQVLRQEGSYIYGPEALVTVTTVRVSPDLRHAKIYMSVYNREDKNGVITELNMNHARLKQLLAERVRRHLRRLPDFDLFLDDTIEEMHKIEALFDRIHKDNNDGEASQ